LRDLDLGSRAAGLSASELPGTTVVTLTSVGTSVGIIPSVQFEANEVGDGMPVGTGISVSEEGDCGPPALTVLAGDADTVGVSSARAGDTDASGCIEAAGGRGR
jgi:hypothetical protein